MLNSIEKIIYLVLFVVFFIVRKYHTAKHRDTRVVKSKLNKLDILLLSVTGLAMVVPLIYVFSDILDFADYHRPILLDIPGVLILIIASICLWLSHSDLSSNWTPTLGIKEEHTLVTRGIYKYIRHPMYAAHIYWAIGQLILLPNWIAGFSLIIFAIIHPLTRIRSEEEMMIEEFGEVYKKYRETTGRFFPKHKIG